VSFLGLGFHFIGDVTVGLGASPSGGGTIVLPSGGPFRLRVVTAPSRRLRVVTAPSRRLRITRVQ
jgi:hypothetical protein